MKQAGLFIFAGLLLIALPLQAQESGSVHIGGYGAIRFEASDIAQLYRTFTFRRLILTTDAEITSRIRFVTELEFERFRKIELEKAIAPENGIEVEQAIEGTSGSEIALEQAWMQYTISDAFKIRAGGLLIPVGRFNTRHDDNLWTFPRRSLVDRGVPVLPSKSAWNELGFGISGMLPVGKYGLLTYEGQLTNGVIFDVEIEQRLRSHRVKNNEEYVFQMVEAEFQPATGTFGEDIKHAKALSGRILFSPMPGHELALSGYTGRYTPEFMQAQTLQSVGVDFLTGWRNFSLEGEFVHTSFGDIRTLTADFARQAVFQKGEWIGGEEGEQLKTEVEFELKSFARSKQGYWIEGRYAFWPSVLNQTFLAQDEDPHFVLGIRWEQVWLNNLLSRAAFADGVITAFETDDRMVNRLTIGVVYRPTSLVGFQIAYERTWTDPGQSLAAVTNYLPASDTEDTANALLFGVVFGF